MAIVSQKMSNHNVLWSKGPLTNHWISISTDLGERPALLLKGALAASVWWDVELEEESGKCKIAATFWA